ncbi:MAG: sugar ABC transporter permease [Firmicutes bacterium]|nr:sugar ABC transporter permease [Bacillota bacterium]
MSNRIFKKIMVIALCFVVLLLFGGCTTARVSFNRDGSGSAVVTVEKEGVSRDDLEKKIDEVIAGVTMQSAESDRLSLGSISETEDAWIVTMNFKRISNLGGLGYYRFLDGKSFGQQRVERNLFSNFAKGSFSSKGSNYDNKTYTIAEDEKNAVQPLTAEGEQVDLSVFSDQSGAYYTEDYTFFSYVICGFEDVTSIEFSFPGKIAVIGDRNLELLDDSTVRVTPFAVTADVIGIDENGQAYREEGVSQTAFAGYVIFLPDTDYTLPIVLGCIGLLLIAGIILGITTGAFRKFARSKTAKHIWKHKVLYLFILPGFLLMAIFNYAPMAGIIVAFKNYTVDDGIFGSEWVGFSHFITLFTHPGAEFWMIFRNTVVMAALKFVFGFPASIILALMFNALQCRLFKRFAQTISYLPYFVSWVVISNIAYVFLSADGGIINNILVASGAEKIRFYSEPKYWWGILTFTSVWKNVGWGTIVYLAAITGINPDLYEAASIDGASSWRKLWTVTIPGMMPVIGIQLILNMGNLIKDDFDQIYSMVMGDNYSLRPVTEVFSSLVYRQLQGGVAGFSSATAVSFVQSIISLILVLGANAIVKKTDNQGLW